MKRSLALLLALAGLVMAQPVPPSQGEAEKVRLAALTARFQQMVDAGELAGAVFLVAHHDETVLLQAAGFQDIEAGKKMRTDAVFQIMSMTKPVTAAGIMLLVDEGRVALSDSIDRYLQEARGQMVSAPGGLRPPTRPVTVRDLLTHTSGMAVPPPEFRDRRPSLTLADAVALFVRQPLNFDPGTRFAYSGTGIATAGRIIEVASGKRYEQFLQERLFAPLGMSDTFFFLDEARQPRLAGYYKLENGRLHRRGEQRGPGRYGAPEGGLYSTVHDMAAFHQLMLNGGVWHGRRILSRSAVEVMTRVHTGDLPTKDPGYGWGLGWHVVKDSVGMLGLLTEGTFGHGGAWGTYGFVDRSKDLVALLMMQHEGPNEDHLRRVFTSMVNAAIDR
jgi:CubicO group peptidase (beta-lactamase class C family)